MLLLLPFFAFFPFDLLLLLFLSLPPPEFELLNDAVTPTFDVLRKVNDVADELVALGFCSLRESFNSTFVSPVGTALTTYLGL